MRLLFLTSGPNVPATRFRVLPFLPRMVAQGHQVRLAHCWPPKYDHWFGFRVSCATRRMLRRIDLFRAARWPVDVVFLERELFATPEWDLELKFRGIAPRFVLDVDDGIYLTNPEKFSRVATASDLVIAGNSGIEAHARQLGCRTTLIPTCVDTERFCPNIKPRPARSVPIIGWTGTSSNLPALGTLQSALARLSQTSRYELRIICDKRPEEAGVSLDGVPVTFQHWNPQTEIDDLRQFDIGLMPLADDPWSRLKCGCKAIQYSAIGIPAVVSPVGVNAEIVVPGQTGFHASSEAEWVDALARLVQQPELRQQLGTAGREWAVERYSVQAHWPAWWKAVSGIPAHEASSSFGNVVNQGIL